MEDIVIPGETEVTKIHYHISSYWNIKFNFVNGEQICGAMLYQVHLVINPKLSVVIDTTDYRDKCKPY